jgi:hypothetical protein
MIEEKPWTKLSHNGGPRDLNLQPYKSEANVNMKLSGRQHFSMATTHFSPVDTVATKDLQFFKTLIDKLCANVEVKKVQYKLCF